LACSRTNDFDRRFEQAAADVPAAVLHHDGMGESMGGNVRGARAGRDHVPDPRLAALADVSRVVRQNLAGVKVCFERESVAGRTQGGKAIVNLSIAANGAVSEVRVDAPDFMGSELPGCVRAQATRWRFPPSKSARAVSYPFVFMAG